MLFRMGDLITYTAVARCVSDACPDFGALGFLPGNSHASLAARGAAQISTLFILISQDKSAS